MRITTILNNHPSYTVFFVPNWLERLFGMKPEIVKYTDTGEQSMTSFSYGIYTIEETGEIERDVDIACAIDMFKQLNN